MTRLQPNETKISDDGRERVARREREVATISLNRKAARRSLHRLLRRCSCCHLVNNGAASHIGHGRGHHTRVPPRMAASMSIHTLMPGAEITPTNDRTVNQRKSTGDNCSHLCTGDVVTQVQRAKLEIISHSDLRPNETEISPQGVDWVTRHKGEPINITREFARFVLSESGSAAQIIKAAGIKFQ